MPDQTYQPGVYRKQGGNELVISSAGQLTTEGQGTVTQITSITTGVTLNAIAGIITTVSQTLAAAAEAEIVVTNNKVAVGDVVVVNVADIAGGAGGPFQATVTAVAAGSFTVAIANTHSATAGNSVLKINFLVLKVTA